MVFVSILTPFYASRLQENKEVHGVKAAQITTSWEETEKKEVVSKLYDTWNKAISKLASKDGTSFSINDFDLYYGLDIGKHFTKDLSNTEAQSFHMSLNEAKKEYQRGDYGYGILLSKDKSSAKVIWELVSGAVHIAQLSRYMDDKLGNL